MTFEKMKKEIEFDKYILDETISPDKDPDKFCGFDNLEYLANNNLSMKDARCLSWKYFSDAFGEIISGTDINYFFNEMQYNSFMHGNKWNKSLPVHLKAGFGERGFVAQIIDSGEGFDFRKKFQEFLERKDYFKNKGRGFNKFHEPRKSYIVSWEGKGNISNLMLKTSGNDIQLWKNRIFNNNYKPILI